MAYQFALEALYMLIAEQVKKDWGSDGVVKVDWGQRAPARNDNVGTVGRICIVPGDDGGALGDLGQPQQWDHQDAEALYQQDELFQIYVFGHDVQRGNEDDFAQDRAVKVVWHELVRAVYIATHQFPPKTSPIKWGKPKQIKPKAQHSCGKEYVCVCTIAQPILDIFDGHSIYTDVAPAIAHLTTTHNGVTDTATTEFLP